MEPSIIAELDAWERGISVAETGDPLWKLHAYRLARYQLDCCLDDLRSARPPLNREGSEQLRRAVASIGVNLSEGYSRRTPADRARFYSYALGSLREAAVWYLSLASVLPTERVAHRMGLIAQERRLLLGVLSAVNRAAGLSITAP
jgi:four helix bundle protein